MEKQYTKKQLVSAPRASVIIPEVGRVFYGDMIPHMVNNDWMRQNIERWTCYRNGEKITIWNR